MPQNGTSKEGPPAGPSSVADLKTFEKLARRLGAAATAKFNPPGPGSPTFQAWASDPMGGCGSPGCRCSPGLWVSATQGAEGLRANFGTDLDHDPKNPKSVPFERGHDVVWGETDHDAWRRFKQAAGVA
jgi:hypothetical protein